MKGRGTVSMSRNGAALSSIPRAVHGLAIALIRLLTELSDLMRRLVVTHDAVNAQMLHAFDRNLKSEQRFVPLREAAKLFSRHPSSLIRWSETGRLPPRSIDPGGRGTGWLLSELRAELEKLKKASH